MWFCVIFLGMRGNGANLHFVERAEHLPVSRVNYVENILFNNS